MFKKRIAIIGSTGSIGDSALKVVSKFPRYFDVALLCCNSNYKKIIKQIEKFSPQNVYINDKKTYDLIVKKNFSKKINFFNNLVNLNKALELEKKFDKVILGVSSIHGLEYSFFFLKHSNEILVANKESIICGGNVLLNKANFYNCKITSIDSEHYCLSQSLKDIDIKNIDTIFLTASGGALLEKRGSFFSKPKLKDVLKHPNWNMGKKITVDSATLVNKVFEIIEAHILFKIPFDKIKIKIHKESLVHSVILTKDGLVRLVAHDTSMLIPIRNSLFDEKFFFDHKNHFKRKNNFTFSFDEKKLLKFKILTISNKVFKHGHSGWIIFNVLNDYLVNKYLNKEIFFYEIVEKLIKILNSKTLINYCKNKKIRNINNIKSVIKFCNNISRTL